jgi:hypothetical protein
MEVIVTMKNLKLSNVEAKFYALLYQDLSIKDLEEWVYTSGELESYLSATDYFEFISLDFNSKHIRSELEKIIEKYVDYGKFETLRMLDLLNKALRSDEDTGLVLITIYDLYCDGYYFLDKLGLEYGLTCLVPPNKYRVDSWEELSEEEQKELIDGFYPKIIAEINRVIQLIETKKIILTGRKDEFDRWEYIINS